MRTVALDGVKNVRDLGGIPVAGNRVVKRGLLFRGAKLYGGSGEDFATLFGVDEDGLRSDDSLGIGLVIDLRIGYERTAKPDPVLAGVKNVHVPFYDDEVVGYEYFKPVPGTITIGKDFACDPGDFYQDMANPLTAVQMGKAIRTALGAACEGTPVYFHCSNGKDRAGVLSLVILELLGADPRVILDDYLLTNQSRDGEISHIYQRFLRLCQGDQEFAQRITDGHKALPENLAAFRASVDQRYGSMESFIADVLGFSGEDRARLRQELTEQA